jgi:hypothetical protein
LQNLISDDGMQTNMSADFHPPQQSKKGSRKAKARCHLQKLFEDKRESEPN